MINKWKKEEKLELDEYETDIPMNPRDYVPAVYWEIANGNIVLEPDDDEDTIISF